MRRARSISCLAAIVAVARGSLAAPPSTLRIVGDERSCPSPAQVAALLAPLLPSSKISAAAAAQSADDVVVLDEGAGFRVSAAGQERSFVEPARACVDRARHAAVFAALALDPPAILEAKPPTPPAPIAPPRPERAEPVREPPPARAVPQLDLQLGGVFQTAPSSGPRSPANAGGGALRARWGQGLHVAAGMGLLAGSLHFASADAKVLWFPGDISLGLNVRVGAYDFAAEVGPTLTLLGITGENLAAAHREWRVEAGIRGSVIARAWIDDRIGLYASAHAAGFPQPYRVVVEPLGDIGSTPSFWWGGSIGIFSRFY